MKYRKVIYFYQWALSYYRVVFWCLPLPRFYFLLYPFTLSLLLVSLPLFNGKPITAIDYPHEVFQSGFFKEFLTYHCVGGSFSYIGTQGTGSRSLK